MLLAHLVKLVDAANPLVAQHQRARFQCKVTVRVFHHCLHNEDDTGRPGTLSKNNARRVPHPRMEQPHGTTVKPVVEVVLPQTYTPRGATLATACSSWQHNGQRGGHFKNKLRHRRLRAPVSNKPPSTRTHTPGSFPGRGHQRPRRGGRSWCRSDLDAGTHSNLWFLGFKMTAERGAHRGSR